VAMTGAYGFLRNILVGIDNMQQQGASVIAIFSYNVNEVDTPYISALELRNLVRRLTSRTPITSMVDAEQLVRKQRVDALVVAPCSGNTLAKLALGITDTPVLIAARGQLMMNRPVVIAPYVSDAMTSNAANLGHLLMRKNIFFVPFAQDTGTARSASVNAHFNQIIPTVESALDGVQLQPVLRGSPYIP
ncbi:MAG: dipicolinate synthase subunit B, partial [Christensenellales bacterium]|jgi:dipicolinate synthase subunit B